MPVKSIWREYLSKTGLIGRTSDLIRSEPYAWSNDNAKEDSAKEREADNGPVLRFV